MPTFWEAVAILELTCKVPIIATVSDGAPTNRKFHRIHRALSGLPNDKIVYRTQNIFAANRYIWFFANASHLMKATRERKSLIIY